MSKKIAGRGGRNVVLPARFSTTGKSFPLKLRLAMRLKEPARRRHPHRHPQHPAAPLAAERALPGLSAAYPRDAVTAARKSPHGAA